MKELKMNIRRATPQDLPAVRAISLETFVESFSDVNTSENMEKYIQKSFNDQVLLHELNNPDIHYYLAYQGEKAIGYLKLNFGKAQTELRDSMALEIERIYVRKAFQGQGIGQHIFEHALEIAVQNKLSYVWLGVWEKNPEAIRFYKRNGFVEFSRHVFKLGSDEQTDIMMKLQLKE